MSKELNTKEFNHLVYNSLAEADNQIMGIANKTIEKIESNEQKVAYILQFIEEVAKSMMLSGFMFCNSNEKPEKPDRLRQLFLSNLTITLSESSREYQLKPVTYVTPLEADTQILN